MICTLMRNVSEVPDGVPSRSIVRESLMIFKKLSCFIMETSDLEISEYRIFFVCSPMPMQLQKTMGKTNVGDNGKF